MYNSQAMMTKNQRFDFWHHEMYLDHLACDTWQNFGR